MKETRICKICGGEFRTEHYTSRVNCSSECSAKAAWDRRGSKREDRTCPICGIIFNVPQSKKKSCCSIKCRGIQRKQEHPRKPPKPYEPKIRHCVTCGAEIIKRGAAKWCKSCQRNGKRDAARAYYKTQQYKEAHRRLALDWQKRNPAKMVAARLARQYPELLQVLYECPCDTNGNGKHHHHFDYSRPYEVLKLCDSCHMKEEKRLRDLAATAAQHTHLTDVPVSLEGDNLTRTSQNGNGDNAPDTDRSVVKVEPVQVAAQTAPEPPSSLAEMR